MPGVPSLVDGLRGVQARYDRDGHYVTHTMICMICGGEYPINLGATLKAVRDFLRRYVVPAGEKIGLTCSGCSRGPVGMLVEAEALKHKRKRRFRSEERAEED